MITSILDYLEETAALYGDKAAYCDSRQSITFSGIINGAKAVATALLRVIDGRQVPVVVFMEKGAHNIQAFLGAVYAGCFYIPIDKDMPIDRVGMIIDILNPAAIVYDNATKENVGSITAGRKAWDCACIEYDDVIKCQINEECLKDIRLCAKTTDLLYVLFTSGSTGTPKGVTISHAAVMDLIEWICGKYSFSRDEKLCSQAPFYFDASVPDIYIPIKTGATLYIPPKSYYTFPKKVLQYIDENEINTLIWVPSALCNVVNCHAFDVCVPSSVRLVIFCGEVMPCKHLNIWRKYIPGALYVNMYGPTEATYACTYYEIEDEFSDEDTLPLGKPCENSEIILVSEEGRAVPQGKTGEICVLGQCLSYGYYNNPEKTRQVFVQNPLNNKWTEYMYRTGDLAYLNGDGALIFAGRKDYQIKRLGYRIELGEIENAMIAGGGIRQACCVYDEDTNDIIAVYCGEKKESALADSLKKRIPSYMMPSRYYILDSLPMNINGKIDRLKIKSMYIGGENRG